MEDVLFFQSHGYSLFGVLHHPADHRNGHSETGLVFCDPFGEEKLWAHRVLVSSARFLALQSWWVLRFDCMGHGDSEGDYQDATVETQVRDIHRAIQVLKDRAGVKRIVLVGLRYGGALAAMAGSVHKDVEALILVNPIIDGEQYFQECLRSNLTTQMTTYGKVQYTRDQMLRDLLAGNAVNIDGYMVSSNFYKGISKMRLGEMLRNYSRPLLVLQVRKDERGKRENGLQQVIDTLQIANASVQFSAVSGEPFWKELKVFAQREEAVERQIVEWMKGFDDALTRKVLSRAPEMAPSERVV